MGHLCLKTNTLSTFDTTFDKIGQAIEDEKRSKEMGYDHSLQFENSPASPIYMVLKSRNDQYDQTLSIQSKTIHTKNIHNPCNVII